MKKILIAVVAFLLALVPFAVRAEESINVSTYQTLGLREALTQEEIKLSEGMQNYAETDDQVTIYLFRGNGCHFCQDFLTFLNSIAGEYGKYFKLVSFEVWYDETNSALLDTISKFMNEDAGGVPYIIIGDKVFAGYAEEYNEDIIAKITSEYESKERYDVFEAYNKSLIEAQKAANGPYVKVIIWNLVFTIIAVIVICMVISFNNKKLLYALNNKETIEEEKVVVKETKKNKKN